MGLFFNNIIREAIEKGKNPNDNNDPNDVEEPDIPDPEEDTDDDVPDEPDNPDPEEDMGDNGSDSTTNEDPDNPDPEEDIGDGDIPDDAVDNSDEPDNPDVGDDTSEEDSNDNTTDEPDNPDPEDNTDEEPNTGDDNSDTPDEPDNPDLEDSSGEEPDTGDNNSDTSDDTSLEDDVSGGDNGNTDEQMKKVEDEINKNLNDKQIDIRVKELQNKYIEVYNICNNINNRVEDINKTDENGSVVDFIISKINETKKLIYDYLSKTFSTKTYIENLTNYNQYLVVLSGIKKLLDEIIQKNEEGK